MNIWSDILVRIEYFGQINWMNDPDTLIIEFALDYVPVLFCCKIDTNFATEARLLSNLEQRISSKNYSMNFGDKNWFLDRRDKFDQCRTLILPLTDKCGTM